MFSEDSRYFLDQRLWKFQECVRSSFIRKLYLISSLIWLTPLWSDHFWSRSAGGTQAVAVKRYCFDLAHFQITFSELLKADEWDEKITEYQWQAHTKPRCCTPWKNYPNMRLSWCHQLLTHSVIHWLASMFGSLTNCGTDDNINSCLVLNAILRLKIFITACIILGRKTLHIIIVFEFNALQNSHKC